MDGPEYNLFKIAADLYPVPKDLGSQAAVVTNNGSPKSEMRAIKIVSNIMVLLKRMERKH